MSRSECSTLDSQKNVTTIEAFRNRCVDASVADVDLTSGTRQT